MKRLVRRAAAMALTTTALFLASYGLVCQLDRDPLHQLQHLRRQAWEERRQLDPSLAPPPEPRGRVILPPYLGRGPLELAAWALWIGLLGAAASWATVRPFAQGLRRLSRGCHELRRNGASQALAEPFRDPLLEELRCEFLAKVASLEARQLQLSEALGQAEQRWQLRRRLLERSRSELLAPLQQLGEILEPLEAHPHREVMQRNVLQLVQLVEQLSPESRPLKLESCELREQVAQAVQLVGSSRVMQKPGQACRVRAVPSLALRAMVNLLDNALKYSPGPVEIECLAEGAVEISDAGPGIPAQELSQALAEFSQLQRDQRGVGLGLHSVQRWMKDMQGRLEVTSNAQGTRARMCFCPEYPESTPTETGVSPSQSLP